MNGISRSLAVGYLAGLALASAGPARAGVAPEQAARLDGPQYTCIGAERAGSPSGVAAYTGKFLGSWPGMKNAHGYEPGPYADEKPLWTITAANHEAYADKLTQGQLALLKRYPQAYSMKVYPSHRDFRNDDWVCERVKRNAVEAEVIHDGLGITGNSGAIPFPFAWNGEEAIWNVTNPHRVFSERAVVSHADVFSNGRIVWGKQEFTTHDPGKNPVNKGSYQDRVGAYFLVRYLLPERERGFTAMGFQPNDFQTSSTQSTWQYQPGTRRVRQAAAIGFDYPVPPSGLRTVDDDYLFNGSPERYDWELLGKKEIYVPYHNFGVNDPALKLSELIQPHTLNPEYVRYELHRVWVIQGKLKRGMRHVYRKRVLYVDEDSWLALWADNYDAQDMLWRASFVNYFYSQESRSFHRGVSVYHDLNLKAWSANYLVNEAGDGWWRLNQPEVTASMFSPDAVARTGH